MALSLDEVKRIAALARLRLTAEEEGSFAQQLSEIVAYVDQLGNFASDPQTGRTLDSAVTEAADSVEVGLDREAVLSLAPRTHASFVVVPRIKPQTPGAG